MAPDRRPDRAAAARDASARAVPRQGVRWRSGARRPVLPAARAADLQGRPRRLRGASSRGPSTRAPSSPSAWCRCSACTHCSACRDGCRSTRPSVESVPPFLAFNTAVSFVTNTNWQNYGGETTMSDLTQMMGLTVQNFASAAVGMAVAVALIRGFTRQRAETIGNFWVDLTRGVTRVLLPLALVLAVVLARSRRRADAPAARCGPSPWRARRRRSTVGPSPARSRSRSWGRTAAAS